MKLHHAGLIVPNMEKAIEFYIALLTVDIVKQVEMTEPMEIFDAVTGLDQAVAKVCLLRGDGFFLELFEFQNPQYGGDPDSEQYPGRFNATSPGIRHLCFQADKIEKSLQRVLELGGSCLGEIRKIPNGGVAVYCRDPFGNIIELTKPEDAFPAL